MRVFLSEAVGAERLVFGVDRPRGTARLRHWKHLAALYRASLAACGIDIRPILRPEIYQAEVAWEACGARPRDWHVAVKPLEHLRPFHGLPNVFVCDWGYPALSTSGGPGAPFLNHVRLLGTAAVVACSAEATADVVRAAGLGRVVCWPPAIAAASTANVARGRESGAGGRFLAAMDADHPPPRWKALLEGFAAARREDGRLKLVVAVDGAAPGGDLRAMLSRSGVDDAVGAVSFVAATAAEAIRDLAPQADFFLDAGPVGGLPVASVEALLAGLPLVAPRSAWLPLPAEAQVPVATTVEPVEAADEPAAEVMSLARERPDAASVCQAVLAAAALAAPARRRIADDGRRFVEHRFGLPAFEATLRTVFRHDSGPLA